MAITAGNYIIRSALDEDIVLLTSGGSKSKNAAIAAGALTESDNRCYWKAAVVSTSYNQIYNLNSGTKTGYIMAASASTGKGITQGAYKAATGRWLATASGNTITVRGQTVNTYYLTPYANANLYATVPENGGNLYLSPLLDDTTAQEFYFEPSTYVNTKLATPTALTAAGSTTIINNGNANSFPLRWNSSSTATVYEQRYRTRRYDTDGTPEDWGEWTDWTMTSASKYTAGVMTSGTNIYAPAVDNTNYIQADVQAEVRLTSAKTTSAYNRTGTVTHGPAVSGIIRKWKAPTLTLSNAVCTRDGLQVSYDSDYTLAGNMLRFVSVMDGATELVSNYILTNQDYTGTVLLDWDALAYVPAENTTLDFTVQFVESNGIVSTTVSTSLAISYDSEIGFQFTPTYTLTDRMSIEAALPAYTEIECWLQRKDLEGKDVWVKCDEIAADTGRAFEICPAFGEAPTVMWIVTNTSGGNTQWGYKVETLTAFTLNTLSYVWNWVDDEKVPHAYIMKYRSGNIVQPGDTITLPANKFVTTGREYPIFRYTKSVDRVLDIEGAILNRETSPNATKADAELLAKADHTVYRQPNGKWYQTAVKSVSFTREMSHFNIQIQQEAETR